MRAGGSVLVSRNLARASAIARACARGNNTDNGEDNIDTIDNSDTIDNGDNSEDNTLLIPGFDCNGRRYAARGVVRGE